MSACFGETIAADTVERNHRFLEEALELVQATGCTKSEAHQLVDYVFNRPRGVIQQEIGGVMVTLAALCLAQHHDMHAAGEIELARVWTKVEQIREKQANKPKHSPLPMHVEKPKWVRVFHTKPEIESKLKVGSQIKIGRMYASENPSFKEGQIITLIEGEFYSENGLFGVTESAPAVFIDDEFESIYHLFDNDLQGFMDCEVLVDSVSAQPMGSSEGGK